jgi:hypothetical protein
VYLGLPALIIHNPRSNFSSKEFRGNAYLVKSDVSKMLTEAYNSIRKVKQYYTPLYRAFNILTKELLRTSREARLQTVVKAVNNTAGPDSLVLTLLVFGAFPCISHKDRPTATNTRRVAIIHKAMAKVRRYYLV